MSYIITATIRECAINRSTGVDDLLKDSKIRLLSKDTEDGQVVLDVSADFDDNAETVRWLCGKLIDAGILEFDIGHSY